MAITSYADFVSGITSLTITGVKRAFDATPEQLSTADLPASFPQIPEDATLDAPITADGQGGWPRLSIELVVVMSPTRQSKPPINFANTVAMMDAIADALRAVPKATISRGPLTWSVRGGISAIGETEYWLVVARIAGSG